MRSVTRIALTSSLLALAAPGLLLAKDPPAARGPVTGPEADYPVVLGPPMTVDGKTFTPSDTLNYDAVGYAIEGDGGSMIVAAHRTLPLPSYIEVTSLETGRTALVRVTTRGPLDGAATLALSPGAMAQIGISGDRAPVRMRRVNPPEAERALLRLGQRAPDRMETPPGLLAVLKRKLAASGDTVLSAGPKPVAGPPPVGAVPPAKPEAPVKPVAKPKPVPAAKAPAKPPRSAPPKPVLQPDPVGPVMAPSPPPPPPKPPVPKPVVAKPATAARGFSVQLGAFGVRANAEALAQKAGASISQAGNLFRVQQGTYPTRPEAERALAKAVAAGYGQARIVTVP